MARRTILQGTAIGSTDIATRGDITTVVGTPVKSSVLPDLTGQAIDIGLDNFLIRDKSNTTQNATTGSLSEITPIELLMGARKSLTNVSTAAAGPGFAADTYLVGSNVAFPAGWPIVGSGFRLLFDVTKTAVGTGTATIIIRIGTAATTADAAICTLAFAASSAVIDSAFFEVTAFFRSVGAATAAVLVANAVASNGLATTGMLSAKKYSGPVVSSGFNSTTASLKVGASYNGGASAAHTVQMVRAEIIP